MNDNQKQVVAQFLIEKYRAMEAINSGDGMKGLVEFVIQTQAQQKAELTKWLDDRKTQTLATKAGLDAEKTAAETRLTNEVALIDAVKGKL